MYKNLTIISVLGVFAIVLGAFGAHALQKTLTIEGLKSFETAVTYQMFHVLVLLVVNLFPEFSKAQKNQISWCFFAGIFFFSGSIYLIQLTPVTAKSIWFLTPLGGLLFIVGWCLMILHFLRKK